MIKDRVRCPLPIGRMVMFLLTVISLFCWPSPAGAAPLEPSVWQLLDGHGSIMLLIDADTGSIRYANPAAVAFYGFSKEQLESMRITDVNALSPEETAAEMQAALAEQRNQSVFKHRLASGEFRTVEVFSYPYSSGAEKLLFSIIHDISEEKALAERHSLMTRAAFVAGAVVIVTFAFLSFSLFRSLRRSQEKTAELDNFNELHRSFIDADSRLIYLKDEHLRYVFVNQALERFMQRPAAEIIGQDDSALAEAEFAALKRTTDVEVLENMAVVVQKSNGRRGYIGPPSFRSECSTATMAWAPMWRTSQTQSRDAAQRKRRCCAMPFWLTSSAGISPPRKTKWILCSRRPWS